LDLDPIVAHRAARTAELLELAAQLVEFRRRHRQAGDHGDPGTLPAGGLATDADVAVPNRAIGTGIDAATRSERQAAIGTEPTGGTGVDGPGVGRHWGKIGGGGQQGPAAWNCTARLADPQ